MAAQAGVEDFCGRKLGEGYDGRLAAARLHVRLARAVAALAAGVLRRFLPRGEALVMGVAVKEGEDVGMASAADVAPYVVGRQRHGLPERDDSEYHPKREHAPTIPEPDRAFVGPDVRLLSGPSREAQANYRHEILNPAAGT
jgi:hypothetical protein